MPLPDPIGPWRQASRALLSILFISIVSGSALAQGSEGQSDPKVSDPPRFHTDTIVTAERHPERTIDVPSATTIITRGDIEQLPATSLGEIVSVVPGFQVLFDDGQGGSPIVSARGFFGGGEADYVRLIVDGVPVSDVESGTADWASLRADAIERVEVLRGPGSSFYGDTAVAGVIQVFTRSGSQPRASVSATGGSFASRSADGGVSASLRSVTLIGSGSIADTDGSRAHADRLERHAALTASFRTSLGSWTLGAAGDSRDLREPGPRTASELVTDRFGSSPFFSHDTTNSQRFRASLSHQLVAGAFDARSVAYTTTRNAERIRTLLLVPGIPDSKFRDIDSHGIGVSTDVHRAWSRFATESRFGAEVSSESLDSTYAGVDRQGDRGATLVARAVDRHRLGLFGSEAWSPAPIVRLVAGLRWDRVEDGIEGSGSSVHQAWSPRAGITLRFGAARQTAIFSNVSRAFKTGTLDQLFDPRPFPDFRGGTLTVSNPNLKPQTVTTVEVGASGSDPALSWAIVAYRLAARNEIDFDPATFSYGNIGRSHHHGVEMETRFYRDAHLSPSLSYTWTRVEPDLGATRGLQLKNIPPRQWRGGLHARVTETVTADVSYARSSGAHLDDEGEFALASRDDISLRVTWRLKRLRVYGDLLNATDDRFEEYGYALSSFTGTRVPYYMPGARRAARVGVRVDF